MCLCSLKNIYKLFGFKTLPWKSMNDLKLINELCSALYYNIYAFAYIIAI